MERKDDPHELQDERRGICDDPEKFQNGDPAAEVRRNR